MKVRAMKAVVLLVAGRLYWQLVCQVTGSEEPWDSDAYWRLWYPVSIALAAVAGYLLGQDGWLAGVVITFAQLPVMSIHNGTGPLIVIGVLLVCVLAVPAAAISLLAGRFAMRFRSG